MMLCICTAVPSARVPLHPVASWVPKAPSVDAAARHPDEGVEADEWRRMTHQLEDMDISANRNGVMNQWP